MVWRILTLSLLTAMLIFFWDSLYILPLKVFVVYLHELSHALAALLTGGEVKTISVSWDESGFTQTIGGNFLAIAGGGYIGSMLFGALMLHSGLSGRFLRSISLFIGGLMVLATLFLPEKIGLPLFLMGIAWGVTFLVIGLLHNQLTRMLLFFMGGLTSLYGLYDIGDFFRGDIKATDAGIIADHYMVDPFWNQFLAYSIAIFISVVSVWILYRMVLHAIHLKTPETAELAPAQGELSEQEEMLLKMQLVENMPTQTLMMLSQLQQPQPSSQSQDESG